MPHCLPTPRREKLLLTRLALICAGVTELIVLYRLAATSTASLGNPPEGMVAGTWGPHPVLERVLPESAVFPDGDPEAPDAMEFEQTLRDHGLIPETLPPVSGLAVGWDGSVWLRREDRGEDEVAWTVLSALGEIQGVVSLPRRLRVAAATDEFFIALDEGALGVPSIVRYERPVWR